MIRIVIAEDYHIVREGIFKLLDESQDFNVIGQAVNGLETIKLVQELQPDVLVLDISMPLMDGIEVLKKLAEINPSPKVVILSMHDDNALVKQAFELGALGYVLKQSVSDELTDAIHAANRGSIYLSAGASHILTRKASKQSQNPLNHLSPRERQVVQKIVNGLSTKEIAKELQVSVKTVEKQRRDAMRKLDVDNVATLVRTSLKFGLLDNSDEK